MARLGMPCRLACPCWPCLCARLQHKSITFAPDLIRRLLRRARVATGARSRSIISCGGLDLRLHLRLALLFATSLAGSQSLAGVRVSVGTLVCLSGRGCRSVLGRFDCGRRSIGRATLQRPLALHLRHAAPNELRTSRRGRSAQGVYG